MITTDQLRQTLHNVQSARRHHAELAASGITPVTNASYALALAAKAETLQSLINTSERDDERRGVSDE